MAPYYPCPGAIAVDALANSWDPFTVYAYAMLDMLHVCHAYVYAVTNKQITTNLF